MTPAPRPFDVARLRADFPILERRIWDRPLVYLDSAASAQKPRAVIEAMTGAMERSYANVHRGLHLLANEATEAFEEARKRVAHFLGAGRVEEIVFTRGSTSAINLVAYGLMGSIKEGDEIVLSQMEHHSNIVPWHFLRERKGAVLRWAPVQDDGRLDMAAFSELLGPRTRMVAMTHMSNVTGTITDGAEIVRRAHAAGAPVLLDGSQSAVHLPKIDVQALGVDFYVITGHKLYGPTGIGALYARGDWLNRLDPYEGGGEMIAEVREERVLYNEPPQKFEAGTPPIIEAIGLAAAIDYLATIDREGALAHENALGARATAGLKRWNDVRILGEAPGKGAILTFHAPGAHAHDLAQLMDRQGVAIRAGFHCAEPLIRRFKAPSTARASFAMYNTEAEVDVFIEAFAKAREMLS